MQRGRRPNVEVHFGVDDACDLSLGLGEFDVSEDMSLSTRALVPVACIHFLGASFQGSNFWLDPLSRWGGCHDDDSLLLHHLLLP